MYRIGTSRVGQNPTRWTEAASLEDAVRLVSIAIGNLALETENACRRGRCGACRACQAALAIYRSFGPKCRVLTHAELKTAGQSVWRFDGHEVWAVEA